MHTRYEARKTEERGINKNTEIEQTLFFMKRTIAPMTFFISARLLSPSLLFITLETTDSTPCHHT